MLLLIIILPLLGFIFGSLTGRFLGKGVCYLTTLNLFVSFILSLILFFSIISSEKIYKVILGSWITVEALNITWCFYFDSLTVVMLIVVTFISTLVHLYSSEYMEFDPHLTRFMSYLSLFTFFMLILVTANNFLQMFVGWEGVGLSSYLLINFWFTRIQANKAAIKAMLVNRVGDFFILLALFSICSICDSLDYDIVFILAPLLTTLEYAVGGFYISLIDMICIFLFLGAMGKSAQLGLHTWLPDAMEGPTPVSALIHAATMVTAGVFLVVRCSYLFEFSPLTLTLIMFIGASTSFFAATTGLFQNDIKKVIAYSTCSQLGYMIFACGLSSYDVALFHLSNHAFFKALLFLGAGSVIHAVADEQDMRKMGGLKNLLPFSYAVILIGSLALMGFPFLTGFYSKDTILEMAFAKYTNMGHFCYYIGSFAAFCTAFYSTRLIFLVFLINPNGTRKNIFLAHEGSWKLGVPLFILTLFSIGVGFLTREFFIGFGVNFWNGALFIHPNHILNSDIEFITLFNKLLPLIFSILGTIFAYMLYAFKLELYYQYKQFFLYKIFYNFINRKWYFDRIYNQIITSNSLYFSNKFAYIDLDRGLIEYIGPSGIINNISIISKHIKIFQSGNFFHYLFLFLFFICLIFFLFFIF